MPFNRSTLKKAQPKRQNTKSPFVNNIAANLHKCSPYSIFISPVIFPLFSHGGENSNAATGPRQTLSGGQIHFPTPGKCSTN